MKELKNPIALLVLILLVAAFIAPFGSTTLAVFARDFLPAAATLVAAYAGALYGATLAHEAAKKDMRLKQIGIGARAMFTIWRQLNTIAQIQEDIVGKYRDYPPAPLAMPPIDVPIDDTIRIDIDGLAFLLDYGKSNLLINLCIAETRFIHAVDAIRRRSALHMDEVQPKLENKIPIGRNLTPDELRSLIGTRLFMQLVEQTQDVISRTDDAVDTLETVDDDLHEALQEIFPEGKFPRTAPLEGEPSQTEKRKRPTGLL